MSNQFAKTHFLCKYVIKLLNLFCRICPFFAGNVKIKKHCAYKPIDCNIIATQIASASWTRVVEITQS